MKIKYQREMKINIYIDDEDKVNCNISFDPDMPATPEEAKKGTREERLLVSMMAQFASVYKKIMDDMGAASVKIN